MKRKLALLFALIGLTSCSFIFGGPSSVTRKFMDAAEKGDVETMNRLFSKKGIEHTGRGKVNSNNRDFSDMVQGGKNRKYTMQKVTETRNGDTAFVSFDYKSADEIDSLGLGFYLSKEEGIWKIDHIGSREREDLNQLWSRASSTPTPFPTPSFYEPPVSSGQATPSKSAQISAGVLNGKATNLPKPTYPAIAKAAKASGQVNVHVTVDESGDVISATPVSGHPLLRAAAVAAARQAKFSPTKLSGQPVKVTGIITYNFVAE